MNSFIISEQPQSQNQHLHHLHQQEQQIPKNGKSFKYISRRILKQIQIQIFKRISYFLHIFVIAYFSYATYFYIETTKQTFHQTNITTNINGTSQQSDLLNETITNNNSTIVDVNVKCIHNKNCTNNFNNNGINWCHGYGMLLFLFIFCYTLIIYFKLIKPRFERPIYETCISPILHELDKLLHKRFIKFGLLASLLIGFGIFLEYDTRGSRFRLQSVSGIIVLFLFGLIFSKYPSRIKLRPVICGFLIQLALGFFCIRWTVGRNIFKCFGDKVEQFLSIANTGSEFVYGNFLVTQQMVMAFKALSVLYFFGLIISILYYWGAMQWVIEKLGWILQKLMGATVCESAFCAGNIFLGNTESLILIRPYVEMLTESEMHTLIASGLATVAGTLFSVYASFGADPANLITSTVMAAPGAICFSKLFYPEIEESKTKSDNIKLTKSNDLSFFSAACNGATSITEMIMSIIANLIAFISLIEFLNQIIGWFSLLIGFNGISFEIIVAYIFIPLAWCLGIEWNDCENVAQIIAKKTVINEFVAYQKLGKFSEEHIISDRSFAITTFAICGFANPCSIGITLGMLNTIAPSRSNTFSKVLVRGFIAGSIICFINACIAGILISDV